MEIGSFEGRSTVWLVENALEDGGEIICVDTWEGGEEHTLALAKNAHKLFKWNTSILAKKHPKKIINQVISTSTDALSKLQNKNNQGRFDFIYIEGSHVAKDVLTDACLAWPLLRRGGALVFDDYGWAIDLPETHKPKMAVNAFIRVFKEELAVIHKGYQVVVQKMR